MVVLAAATALLAAGCGDDGESLPAGAVARVGDATISEKQLDQTIERTRAQAQAAGQTLPAEGEEGYDLVRQQAFQLLFQQKVIEFEAGKCGTPCRVTDKDVQAEITKFREANKLTADKDFDAFLKQQGIAKADVPGLIKQDLQRTKLEEHVTRGVRFSDADAKKYYDANPGQFDQPAGRTASHILVKTEAEADRIRAQITPENFADLAEQYSTDTATAKNGGQLPGTLQKGTLVPPFEKAAFALGDGEISQPVKTIFGWHIIMVNVTPAKKVTFAEVKDQIVSGQISQRRQQAFSDWSEEVLGGWRDRTVYADDALKPAEADDSGATEETPTTTTP